MVFLFIVILLAVAGLLGVVLKAVALLILTAVLAAIAVGVAAYLAIRRQLRTADGLTRGGTTISIGRAHRGDAGDGPEPPLRDDRY